VSVAVANWIEVLFMVFSLNRSSVDVGFVTNVPVTGAEVTSCFESAAQAYLPDAAASRVVGWRWCDA
jgi:hypothetical protein